MIIYYVPAGGIAQRMLLIQESGTPKRYRRVWLDLAVGTDDWTSYLPETAIKVWEGDREDGRPCWTCPDCGMTSYNPQDVSHKYCGNCNTFPEQREGI